MFSVDFGSVKKDSLTVLKDEKCTEITIHPFFFFLLPVGPVEKKKKFIVALETVFAGKGELMD